MSENAMGAVDEVRNFIAISRADLGVRRAN